MNSQLSEGHQTVAMVPLEAILHFDATSGLIEKLTYFIYKI